MNHSSLRFLASRVACAAAPLILAPAAIADVPPRVGRIIHMGEDHQFPVGITPDGLGVAFANGSVWSPCFGGQFVERATSLADIAGHVQRNLDGELVATWKVVGRDQSNNENKPITARVSGQGGTLFVAEWNNVCVRQIESGFGISQLVVGRCIQQLEDRRMGLGFGFPDFQNLGDPIWNISGIICPWWLPTITFECPESNPLIDQPINYAGCSGFDAFNWKVSNDGGTIIGMATVRDPISFFTCQPYLGESFVPHDSEIGERFAGPPGSDDDVFNNPILAWPRPSTLRDVYSYVVKITQEDIGAPGFVSTPYWLPGLSNGPRNEVAWQVSGSGAVAVGEAADATTDATAVRWVPGQSFPGFPAPQVPTHLERLDPDGRFQFSAAYATSNNGQVIGGAYRETLDSPAQAFLFVEGIGMFKLEDYLLEVGVDLTGWTLTAVTIISDDGGIIGGVGEYEGLTAGWYFQPDCGGDGINDRCQILNGDVADCNNNFVDDACDIDTGASLDCNANGVPDECDLRDGTSNDCNGNAIPDECDLLTMDCNQNGVPDDCECKVDLVIIIDTSGSMQDPIDSLCQTVNTVVDQLNAANVDLSVKAYEITAGGSASILCLDTAGVPIGVLVNELGNDVPGLTGDPSATLADVCAGDAAAPFEAWADAASIVAARYPWRADAGRVIVTISDECPHCGSHFDGCEPPTTTTSLAFSRVDRACRVIEEINREIASRSRPIRIFPVTPTSDGGDPYTDPVGAWGKYIADRTRGFALDRAPSPIQDFAQELGEHMVAALQASCAGDCNFNHTPDECEPTPPCCRWCAADFQLDYDVDIDDMFSFLNAWFANGNIDGNCDGVISGVDEVFLFLNAWFAGCP